MTGPGWWGYLFDSRPERKSPEGGVNEAGARRTGKQTIIGAGQVPAKEATAKAPAEARAPPRDLQKPLGVCQQTGVGELMHTNSDADT
eukprot:6102189-Pyramimonas_sp.AAC.1